jgi:hypothetical protein
MFALFGLAWSEFKVGFSRRKTGAPGVRDFVALAAFFGLMMFLFLLGWSVRDGLWGRIEQVLLGALPDGQPPIRLSYHIDNANKINTNILDDFAKSFPRLLMVPERSGDGEKGAVILPGLNVLLDSSGKIVEIKGPWGPSRRHKRTVPFRLQALPLDSPLWAWALNRNMQTRPEGLPPSERGAGPDSAQAAGPKDGVADARGKAPLLIAASRHLFDQHFRYDVYRQSILSNRLVPCDLKRELPENITKPDDLKRIILEVKENVAGPGGKRSTVPAYHAFDVLWVDSFPIATPTAILLPLSTYEIFLLSAENQLAEVRPDQMGQGGNDRISQIRLTDIDLEQKGQPEFLALARCVGAAEGQDEAAAPTCGDPSAKPAASLPPETTGTCESLRERMPVKYPRIINNGQDLLICTGEHRRLRTQEVKGCFESAGIDGLNSEAPDFKQRFSVTTAAGGGDVDWRGASVLAVSCAVLKEQDLTLARALAEDRRVADASIGPQAAAALPDWIDPCAAWKDANADAQSGGPPAFYNLGGYQDVTVYPKASAKGGAGAAGPHAAQPINLVIKDLLAWETMLGRPAGGEQVPVFSLNQEYESALVRFGVLSLIIEKVSTPLALGSLALYLALSLVILSTATAHRRRQYGLLLMTGLTPANIGWIITLQILFSCIVGGIAGIVLFEATVWIVNTLLAQSTIMNEARLLIGLDVPTFLSPITGQVMLTLWLAMLLLAVGIGMLIVYMQGIITARAPIELVKS